MQSSFTHTPKMQKKNTYYTPISSTHSHQNTNTPHLLRSQILPLDIDRLPIPNDRRHGREELRAVREGVRVDHLQLGHHGIDLLGAFGQCLVQLGLLLRPDPREFLGVHRGRLDDLVWGVGRFRGRCGRLPLFDWF